MRATFRSFQPEASERRPTTTTLIWPLQSSIGFHSGRWFSGIIIIIIIIAIAIAIVVVVVCRGIPSCIAAAFIVVVVVGRR